MVVVLVGDTVLYTAVIGKSDDNTKYELRLGTEITSVILKPSHTYYMRVFEVNDLLGYKQYLHEEKIKVRF